MLLSSHQPATSANLQTLPDVFIWEQLITWYNFPSFYVFFHLSNFADLQSVDIMNNAKLQKLFMKILLKKLQCEEDELLFSKTVKICKEEAIGINLTLSTEKGYQNCLIKMLNWNYRGCRWACKLSKISKNFDYLFKIFSFSQHAGPFAFSGYEPGTYPWICVCQKNKSYPINPYGEGVYGTRLYW